VRDRFYDDEKRPTLLARSAEEMANVKRKGNVEEVVRMYLKYHADAIAIETVQLQKGIYNDARELLLRMGCSPTMMPYYPRQEKIAKLRECPLNLFEVGLYFIRPDMKDLEGELSTFPDTKLDSLDAIHIAEQMLTKPPKLERGYFNVINKEEDNSLKMNPKIDYFMILP